MYGELPYKYKYMLNKIINCIIQYIMNNLNNNLVIEKKLILINNYILDVFSNSEFSRNVPMNTQRKNQNLSIFMDKSNSNKVIAPNYDNNITFSKLSNVIINIGQKNINEKERKNNNEHNKIKISPFNVKNKEKDKIIKLKRLLKNVQEKSVIKELSYLKKLSFVQEKLNFYEGKKANNDKLKNSIDLDIKDFSFKFDKEKKLKTKIDNNTININNNLDFLTLMNSYRNNRINLFSPNNSKIIKHAISHRKIYNSEIKNKF